MADHIYRTKEKTIMGKHIVEAEDLGELVRCKDCKYWNSKQTECEGIGHWFGLVDEWSANGFCYKGERITDERSDI